MKVQFTIEMPEDQFDAWLEDYHNKNTTDLSGLLHGKKGFITSWAKEIKTTYLDEKPGTLKEFVSYGEVSISIDE